MCAQLLFDSGMMIEGMISIRGMLVNPGGEIHRPRGRSFPTFMTGVMNGGMRGGMRMMNAMVRNQIGQCDIRSTGMEGIRRGGR